MFGIYNTDKLYFAKINGKYARHIYFTIVKPVKPYEFDLKEYLYKDIFSKYYYYTQDNIGDLYLENIAPLTHQMPKKYMTVKELEQWLEENQKCWAS